MLERLAFIIPSFSECIEEDGAASVSLPVQLGKESLGQVVGVGWGEPELWSSEGPLSLFLSFLPVLEAGT